MRTLLTTTLLLATLTAGSIAQAAPRPIRYAQLEAGAAQLALDLHDLETLIEAKRADAPPAEVMERVEEAKAMARQLRQLNAQLERLKARHQDRL